MTVQQIIDAILTKACGDRRIDPTCDQLMTGDRDAEVRGIATTFIVTPDVVRQAAAQDINFIITHEPTWFTGVDQTDWCANDPVYLAKHALLQQHQMNVWRFHDHMHMGGGDLIYAGWAKELGWEAYRLQDAVDTSVPFGETMGKWLYDIPHTTLAGLVGELKRKLDMDTMRIVGNPDMPVARVGVLVGGGSLGLGVEQMPMQFMQSAGVEVMLCGDITEWTLCSYVNDAAQMGMPRAMVILGHERSEEAGMKHLPQWVQPLVGDIPVRFIDAREPFRYL